MKRFIRSIKNLENGEMFRLINSKDVYILLNQNEKEVKALNLSDDNHPMLRVYDEELNTTVVETIDVGHASKSIKSCIKEGLFK